MRTKIWVAVMAILAVSYIAIFGSRGLLLIAEPSIIAQLIGVSMFVFPLVALWSIAVEIKFGFDSERLSKRLTQEKFPELELELRPSGKAHTESAKVEFQKVKQQLESNESDWRLWFRLGEAYEASGDRKRARAAIREAIKLASNNS